MNVFRQALQNATSKVPKPSGQASGAAGKLLAVTGMLGAGAYVVLSSIYTVNPGHQAIVYNRIGGLDEHTVRTEGLNFVIPWLQRPIIYDCRTRPKLVSSTSGSKGGRLRFIFQSIRFVSHLSHSIKPSQTCRW